MPEGKLHKLTLCIDALIMARIMENDGETHLDEHKDVNMVEYSLDNLDHCVRRIIKEEE